MRIAAIALFCFMAVEAFSQLTGKVVDEHGEPLPFVSVYVRSSTQGVMANGNGEFKLPLDPGQYDVIFQYLGYKQHVEQVRIAVGKPIRLRIQMEPTSLELQEVVITTKDPAEQIMRKAIEKRNYYKKLIPDYTCDVYVKGLFKLVDAPKKIMGKDIGDMDGMLDSNQQGIVYLSESVSKLYVASNKQKEVMISSKVSGDPKGFSINRATLIDFDLYSEYVAIERQLLSPLADNAFDYYRFVLQGRYKDNNNYDILKIKVTPKRPYDPAFFGYVYIVDEWWNLAGAELGITGNTIKQPVLDTLTIRQEFVPVATPDKWRLLSQQTNFKFGLLGFKIRGYYSSSFSQYNIAPAYETRFFNKETFKVEGQANERDSVYWARVRPSPLTAEEVRDYVRKDSISAIRTSKAYMDSTDRKNNRFKMLDILTGYTWNNTYQHTRFSWPSIFESVQFNTVQGLVLNFKPTYKRSGEEDRHYWTLTGALNYGFAEDRFRPALYWNRRAESIFYTEFSLGAGRSVEQFDNRPSVGPLLNTVYSLLRRQNYAKFYEKTFFEASVGRNMANGLRLELRTAFEDRAPLINNSDYTWYSGEKNRYTPNHPVLLDNPSLNTPFFQQHQAFMLEANVRIRFGETYSAYPDMRVIKTSTWPAISLLYRKAITGVAGSDANFDYVQADINQSNLKWGLAGYTQWSLRGGWFPNSANLPFMDYYHPPGNELLFVPTNNEARRFLLLPYYINSSSEAFAEAHVQHRLEGWLLDKLPLIRRLNLKEAITLNGFYTTRASADPRSMAGALYWEAGFGLYNLGFKALRPLRLDVVSSFENGRYIRTGLVIGVSM